MIRKFFVLVALLTLSLGLSTQVQAQQYGGYQPPVYNGRHDMQGFVAHFDGHYALQLRVDGNFFPVQLHQGTIINPTGTTLHHGMLVNIRGFWTGAAFQADRINVIRF